MANIRHTSLSLSVSLLRPARYHVSMKAFFLLILLASMGLVLASCESDLPPDPNAPNAQDRLGRGLSGHGTITPPDPQDSALSPDNSHGGN